MNQRVEHRFPDTTTQLMSGYFIGDGSRPACDQSLDPTISLERSFDGLRRSSLEDRFADVFTKIVLCLDSLIIWLSSISARVAERIEPRLSILCPEQKNCGHVDSLSFGNQIKSSL